MTYDPEEGWSEYASEKEAREAFDALIEVHRDAGADGFHEDVESVRLVRADVVASASLVVLGHSTDDSEYGEMCRENGWDFAAELCVVEDVDTSSVPA